ncbi:hypothetical protein BDR26DRAFT_917585 [Obelidium mucronatum]|nr:hypothetical protein BDR26DRAFT_917585 [Obelidium mucronatum]
MKQSIILYATVLFFASSVAEISAIPVPQVNRSLGQQVEKPQPSQEQQPQLFSNVVTHQSHEIYTHIHKRISEDPLLFRNVIPSSNKNIKLRRSRDSALDIDDDENPFSNFWAPHAVAARFPHGKQRAAAEFAQNMQAIRRRDFHSLL